MEQFELDLGVSVDVSKLDKNPMVRAFGFGPQDKRCKHCEHIIEKWYSRKYFKCELRGNTNGAGTDHRVNWNSCSKFSEE